MIKIYCLYEPHTCKIRYIGRTRSSLKRRLIQHKSKARNNYSNSHKENWIRKLLKNGIEPRIRLLTTLDMSWKESHEFEKSLISKHYLKHNLTNGDDRGPGGLGGKNICVDMEKIRVDKIKSHFSKPENKINFYTPIYAYDNSGNFKKRYESSQFAVKELGICNVRLANHLQRSKTQLPNSIKGLHFRHFKTTQIPVPDRYQSNHVKVLVKDLESGEETIFNTYKDFSEHFKLGSWDIHQLRNNKKTKRIKEISKQFLISPF